MKHYFKFFALFIITLILASCATKPQYSPEGVSEAEQLYLTKQYAEAAIAFNQQANSTSDAKQTLLLLRAVIAYVKAEQLTRAVQLYHSIQIDENDLQQTSLSRLTNAHIALAERNAEEVLAQLSKPLARDSSAILLAEFHELRATAFSMQGDRITTAEEYVLQGRYLTNNESILQSQL
jgi:outer membrane PBP1 activator LpoA protein